MKLSLSEAFVTNVWDIVFGTEVLLCRNNASGGGGEVAAQKGSPRTASYFHISDNLYIKFDNNDKKGNLGNQWQSLISSLRK